MKQLLQLMTSWYYWKEFRTFLLLGAFAAFAGFVTVFSNQLSFFFHSDGMVWICFAMGGIVLGLVIQMYYRILMIKYAHKQQVFGL